MYPIPAREQAATLSYQSVGAATVYPIPAREQAATAGQVTVTVA